MDPIAEVLNRTRTRMQEARQQVEETEQRSFEALDNVETEFGALLNRLTQALQGNNPVDVAGLEQQIRNQLTPQIAGELAANLSNQFLQGMFDQLREIMVDPTNQAHGQLEQRLTALAAQFQAAIQGNAVPVAQPAPQANAPVGGNAQQVPPAQAPAAPPQGQANANAQQPPAPAPAGPQPVAPAQQSANPVGPRIRAFLTRWWPLPILGILAGAFAAASFDATEMVFQTPQTLWPWFALLALIVAGFALQHIGPRLSRWVEEAIRLDAQAAPRGIPPVDPEDAAEVNGPDAGPAPAPAPAN